MATEIQGAKIVTEEIENAAGANPYSITLGTESTTTGGSTLDITGIPSGVKRITVMFVGVSTSGTSDPMIQIGDSGGFETSGYDGACQNAGGSVYTTYSSGYVQVSAHYAADVIHGTCVLSLEDSANFTWSEYHTVSDEVASVATGSGSKSLSGELTQLRITTVGGSETIDINGGINVQFQ